MKPTDASAGVLVNPTRAELTQALIDAAEQANQGARSRRVAPFTPEHLQGRAGVAQQNGGGSPGRTSHPVRSSYVGATWWTDGRGNRYVRCEGGRQKVRSGDLKGPAPLPEISDTWSLLFRDRAYRCYTQRSQRIQRLLVRRGRLPEDLAREIGYLPSPGLSAHTPEAVLIVNEVHRPQFGLLIFPDALGTLQATRVTRGFVDRRTKFFQQSEGPAGRISKALAQRFRTALTEGDAP